jgi:hypothetical protein
VGDIIEMDLMGIGWAVVGWIYLAEDVGMWQVFVNMVINLGNLLTGQGSISYSRTLPVSTARAGICCHLNVRQEYAISRTV